MSTARFNTLQNAAGSKSVPVDTVVDGSAKAWVNFNGTGTVAIRAAFNVSSIADNGVGDYTVNFTTAMTDANYCMAGTCNTRTNHPARCVSLIAGGSPATGSIRVTTGIPGAQTVVGSQEDCEHVNVSIFR